MGKVRKVVQLVCLRKGPFASKSTPFSPKKKIRRPLVFGRAINILNALRSLEPISKNSVVVHGRPAIFFARHFATLTWPIGHSVINLLMSTSFAFSLGTSLKLALNYKMAR